MRSYEIQQYPEEMTLPAAGTGELPNYAHMQSQSENMSNHLLENYP